MGCVFLDLKIDATAGSARPAVEEGEAVATHGGASAHLVVEAGGERVGVLRAFPDKLQPAGLAVTILGQFQRTVVEQGAAGGVSARRQGGGVGQRGAEDCSAQTVGGGPGGAGSRDRKCSRNARHHRVGGGAGEDRRPRSKGQAEELGRGAIGVGGHQVKCLHAGVVGGGGCAGDDPRGRIERQPGGQCAVGGDAQVVDRVAAGDCGTGPGAEGKLPVRAVGRVDLAGQIHPQFLDAVVAHGEHIGAVELDLDRLGRAGEGDRGRSDYTSGAAPSDIDPWVGGDFDEVDRKAVVGARGHQTVLVVAGGGRDDAVVKAGAVASAGGICFVIEGGGEGTGAARAQLGQDQGSIKAVTARIEHQRPLAEGGGAPGLPIV